VLVPKDATYQFACLNPQPIKFFDEVNDLGRCIGIRVGAFERILLRCVEAWNKPISYFKFGRVAEPKINNTVCDVVSLSREIPALGTNKILTSLFQRWIWVPLEMRCVSAWNKDPVFGVIGIQSGPRG
jgi:hypothetical protein